MVVNNFITKLCNDAVRLCKNVDKWKIYHESPFNDYDNIMSGHLRYDNYIQDLYSTDDWVLSIYQRRLAKKTVALFAAPVYGRSLIATKKPEIMNRLGIRKMPKVTCSTTARRFGKSVFQNKNAVALAANCRSHDYHQGEPANIYIYATCKDLSCKNIDMCKGMIPFYKRIHERFTVEVQSLKIILRNKTDPKHVTNICAVAANPDVSIVVDVFVMCNDCVQVCKKEPCLL